MTEVAEMVKPIIVSRQELSKHIPDNSSSNDPKLPWVIHGNMSHEAISPIRDRIQRVLELPEDERGEQTIFVQILPINPTHDTFELRELKVNGKDENDLVFLENIKQKIETERDESKLFKLFEVWSQAK